MRKSGQNSSLIARTLVTPRHTSEASACSSERVTIGPRIGAS
jgi:hypothetical protein